MANTKFFKCERCGNVVALLNNGGGTLACCGEPMKLLEAKSMEDGKEKHLPVVAHENSKLIVKVGSIAHPMTDVHHIVFIALEADGELKIKYLDPTGKPEAEFDDVKHGTVYSYCNIHGLWKSEF